MEGLVIRQADRREDFVAALAMVEELALFESLTPPDQPAQERFLTDGFDRIPPRFEIWLAEVSSETAGYILIFETYSTFLCKPTLYLEDLYVRPQHRRLGIGGKLLEHCIALAKERGCGRMEWTCLDWNTKAQEVYEGLGAVRMGEWFLYRLTEDRFGG